MTDTLTLEVRDLDVDVLTGIYSEETHLPQPLRLSIAAEYRVRERYDPDTPLDASKNYMDLKYAATTAIPEDVHFKLIEAVADHVIETLFLQDRDVLAVTVTVVKLLLTEKEERIGVTLSRRRPQ